MPTIDASSIVAVVAAIVTSVIGHAIMGEKVKRLERDAIDLRNEQKNCVTFQHFDAVIRPLTRALEILESDVKEILHVVSTTKKKD